MRRYETTEMEIMISYLHRRKGIDCEIAFREDCFDDRGADWSDQGDDPMAYRSDYDRDMAYLLDGWKDGEDVTQRKGFSDLFVKGRVSKDAPEGHERYDGLYRNTRIFVSVQPGKCPTVWLENADGEIMPDGIDLLRVRRASVSPPFRDRGWNLYLRVTGGVHGTPWSAPEDDAEEYGYSAPDGSEV